MPTEIPGNISLPAGFTNPYICLPGILAIGGPRCTTGRNCSDVAIEGLCQHLAANIAVSAFPLIVVVDDSEFAARTLNNFLWVTFTRSNPASDIYGVGSFNISKHWGCSGSLVIDARSKEHHAPPLVPDLAIERRVDAMGAPGGVLHGII